MQEWSNAISSLYKTVFSDAEGFKVPEIAQVGDDHGIDLMATPPFKGHSKGLGKGRGSNQGKGKNSFMNF